MEAVFIANGLGVLKVSSCLVLINATIVHGCLVGACFVISDGVGVPSLAQQAAEEGCASDGGP
eukprot:2833418-Amphidinium_carterae.1